MTLAIDRDAPPIALDETGTARVGGTRVTLDIIVEAFLSGQTAELIAESYPSVSLIDVYATIAYYLRHRTSVDNYLEEHRQQSDEMRRQIVTQPEYKLWRERLLAKAGKARS